MRTTASREVYRNAWMTVREDQVERDDGGAGCTGWWTSLRCHELRHLGHLYGAYGFCSQGFDVYVASGLEAGDTSREASEQDMRHRAVTEAEFQRMVRDGAIVDGPTVAAYGLLLLERL